MTRSALPVFALVLMSLPAHAQLVIAHRGASADAPENTVPAFKLAFEQGADGVETDIYLTRDNQIICLHDKDTQRTTGKKLAPAESTLPELRALDAGTWFDPKFAGTKLPTLDEVFAVVPPGKLFYIEIKCGPEIVPYLRRALASGPLKPQQTVIISFHDDAIAECRREIPGVKAQLIQGFKQDKQTKAWKPTVAGVLKRLKACGASGLDTQAVPEVVDEAFVKSLRKGGWEFHTWTVDKPEEALRLKKLGVDSVTTNKPALIKAALRK